MNPLEVDLLFKYPLIARANDEKTSYTGYITVNGHDVELAVKPHKNGFKVRLPQNGDCERVVNAELRKLKPTNVLECVKCVQGTLSQKLPPDEVVIKTDVYRVVLQEFRDLCEIYVNLERCFLTADLSEVRLVCSDFNGRKHELVIGVDYAKSSAEIFFVKRHNLPKNSFDRDSSSLKEICEEFQRIVRSLQSFWDVMDVFDGSFWILDPESPKRGDVHRRIVLGENLSVIATFDPFNINNPPDLKFLGAEARLEKFRGHLVENLAQWDSSNDVIKEFLKLLGVDYLPKKPHELMDTALLYEAGECCICFCSRLEEKLPEIVCPNSSCEVYFHTNCLYQYLMSLNARKAFNKIRGSCPNCEKPITCPIP